MPKLVFYRQKRADGGLRTGVELDDNPIAETFEEGVSESDPALLWYVDLRCEGEGIPTDADDAADWLIDNGETIQRGFARYADELRAGMDPDIYSLIWAGFNPMPQDVHMEIACSAIRRIDARHMAELVAEIGLRWYDILHELDILEAEDIGG
jgi:hypothetical protein